MYILNKNMVGRHTYILIFICCVLPALLFDDMLFTTSYYVMMVNIKLGQSKHSPMIRLNLISRLLGVQSIRSNFNDRGVYVTFQAPVKFTI